MNRQNIFKVLFVLIITSACAATPPENPDNICLIFEEKRGWYKAAIQTQKRWKIPPHVLMAVVFQESSFDSNASLLASTVPPVATKDLLTTLSLIGNPILFCN